MGHGDPTALTEWGTLPALACSVPRSYAKTKPAGIRELPGANAAGIGLSVVYSCFARRRAHGGAVLGVLIPDYFLIFSILPGMDGKHFTQMPDIIEQGHLQALILGVSSLKTNGGSKKLFNGCVFEIVLTGVVDIIEITKDVLLRELRHPGHFLLSVSSQHPPTILTTASWIVIGLLCPTLPKPALFF